MREIETRIINYYKENLVVPDTFENAIKHALNNKDMQDNSFIKLKYIKYIIAILLLCIISPKVVSFAYIYYKYKANNTIGYVSESTNIAIENGYIQNVDMDYIYYKGVGIKIDYIVMSDYNLNILFDFNFGNQKINTDSLELKDLIIYDENKNIIFCYDTKAIREFANTNFISWKNKDGSFNQYSDGYGVQLIEMDEKTNKILYKVRSGINGFPNSKKLFFSFTSIYDYRENKEIFSGNWNLEINLSEKFYNRENLYYSIDENKNNSTKIELIEAVTTDTITRVTIRCDYTEKEKLAGVNLYLKDNNEKIYSRNNIDEDNIYIRDNIISATFAISKPQNTDIQELIVTIDNKEEIIYLKEN